MAEATHTTNSTAKVAKMEDNNGEIFGVRRTMKRWFSGPPAAKPKATPPTRTATPTPIADSFIAAKSKAIETNSALKEEPAEEKKEQTSLPSESQNTKQSQSQATPTSTPTEATEPTTAESEPTVATTSPAPLKSKTSTETLSASKHTSPATSRAPTPSPSSRQSTPVSQPGQKRNTAPAVYLSRNNSRTLDGEAAAGEEEDQVPESIKPSTLLPKSTITTTITATASKEKKGLRYRLSTSKRWSACGPQRPARPRSRA